MTGIESDIGREFDIIHRYHDFSNKGSQGIFPDQWERRLANGEDGADRTLLLNWTTRIHGSDERVSWQQVASGAYDESVIRPAAQRVKEWDRPIFLAFDHEAEGNRRPTQGDGADYVAAWRHIYEIFQEVGADNVIWTWIHVGWIGLEHTVKSFYPGDEYVDWIGYDPFNYYVCRDNEWRSPGEAIGRWYNWLQRNGFDHKPILLGEYGTVADPENEWAQAEWYRNLVPALRKFPRIRAVAHFNTHKVCDTRVTTRPDVLEAWGEAGRHPYVTIQND
ncbi:glycoside hydrolase family 26 protein [Streptomyces sp. 6N223]|uniref:glycoside hydrolase family 26 protein n=1 Tax=Streptomyces sp. 6N223 TaxID=3457412 RepID=UPI003FD58ABA